MLKIRFFTLGQYPQEQAWLEEEAARGNILQKMKTPCFYWFQKEEPQNLVYRYDFVPSGKTQEDCISLYEDYGWTYVGQINDFLLFVHDGSPNAQPEPELFSSQESRDEMVQRIMRKRMIPLLVLFVILLGILMMLLVRQADPAVVLVFAVCVLFTGWLDFSCLLDLLHIRRRIRQNLC